MSRATGRGTFHFAEPPGICRRRQLTHGRVDYARGGGGSGDFERDGGSRAVVGSARVGACAISFDWRDVAMVNVGEHGATQWPDGGLAASSQGRQGSSLEEDSLATTARGTSSTETDISMSPIAADASVSGPPPRRALSPCDIAHTFPATSVS